VLIPKFPSTPNGKIDRKALENYTTSQSEKKDITNPIKLVMFSDGDEYDVLKKLIH
jgi:hypothetical protein